MGKLTFAAAVVVVAAVSAAAVAASGQGRSERSVAPQATQVSGNITFATWASNPIETKLLDRFLNAFRKKYPKIKVNHLTFEPGYPDTMLARFAARKAPDAFYVNMDLALDWTKQGVVQDLTPYIQKYHYSMKPFFPKLLSAFQVKGKTYGFPKDWSPLGMETNNALLAKAKVKPAAATWPSRTRTRSRSSPRTSLLPGR